MLQKLLDRHTMTQELSNGCSMCCCELLHLAMRVRHARLLHLAWLLRCARLLHLAMAVIADRLDLAPNNLDAVLLRMHAVAVRLDNFLERQDFLVVSRATFQLLRLELLEDKHNRTQLYKEVDHVTMKELRELVKIVFALAWRYTNRAINTDN
ncbi:hypothetical protein QJQ45_029764 [Haematococcus lacustris]|nr:hypothetical protein QJQ45_029764 [Haematococcus lacustris]